MKERERWKQDWWMQWKIIEWWYFWCASNISFTMLKWKWSEKENGTVYPKDSTVYPNLNVKGTTLRPCGK